MMRMIRYVAWAGIAVLAVVLAAAVALRPQDGERSLTLPGAATIGGPFELTTHDGARYSSTALKGRPYAIFFGFTNCPDVCPTKLNDLTSLMEKLGGDANRLAVLFVSVDPERDTQSALKQYLSVFDQRIIGLTGSTAEISAIAKAYRIFYKRVPAKDSYTYDHTALVFLFDKAGQLVSTLSPEEASEVQLKKLKALFTR